VTDVTRSENEGWSGYGAERSQPVATGGKCNAVETRRNRPKPLPWVATSCRVNGKEGVDGSSPSEGFRFLPAQVLVPFSGSATNSRFDVHPASTNVHRLLLGPADGRRASAGLPGASAATRCSASRRQADLRFTSVFGICARA
jgi:hypothetical protein